MLAAAETSQGIAGAHILVPLRALLRSDRVGVGFRAERSVVAVIVQNALYGRAMSELVKRRLREEKRKQMSISIIARVPEARCTGHRNRVVTESNNTNDQLGTNNKAPLTGTGHLLVNTLLHVTTSLRRVRPRQGTSHYQSFIVSDVIAVAINDVKRT